ncbi:MAG: NRDE family protein [Candidatus Sericytochromatia bacterium]
MCLIVLAWKTHPDYPLLLVANRDEFRARPTAPLQIWDSQPPVYAGRDLEQGGTWLGLTPQGRFAAVTNLRGPQDSSGDLSRGMLVKNYLQGRQNPADFLEQLHHEADRYRGFNLLVGTPQRLMYASNQNVHPRLLTPGIYGLSNATLNTSWPKVEESKVAFTRLISKREPDFEALLEMMHSTQRYPRQLLPDTGVGPEQEHALSSIFVDLEQYGTRATTLMSWHRQGDMRIVERSYSDVDTWQDTELTLQFQSAA